MRKLTTAAIGAACLMFGAGGATLYTRAATGPAVYNVYEANVTDEDAYKKALPEVQKIIKENSGVYLAGGFNKAKTDFGKPETGNRFVIIRYDSEAAYDKFWNGGGKAWIEKYAPQRHRNPPDLPTAPCARLLATNMLPTGYRICQLVLRLRADGAR
jgi:uncharacterized protein (DUF1330 family)